MTFTIEEAEWNTSYTISFLIPFGGESVNHDSFTAVALNTSAINMGTAVMGDEVFK